MLVNMNDVLLPARTGKYAVGLFNTVNLELARGVIAAAEEMNSPVIIGTAEILLPFGPLRELADLLIPMAERASVPVVVHLDHGLKEETCKAALEYGFSSVMYDCSTASYEENVERVAAMTALAHKYGATIEAELGHVGDNEGSAEATDEASAKVSSEQLDPTRFYTDPSMAKDFIEKTKADALAIAVGTAHGAYKLPPKLDFDRITEIAGVIDTPLVLHGGSGLTDQDFKTAIERGISKINIFTDINNAGAKAAAQAYCDGKGLTDTIPSTIDAIKKSVMEKMILFGSVDKK
ncbi:MAG: class II fructose-bisphosphate aldolase [Lachnospiraceae bacterium]|nr:class II fructose-bisphosphate aldolase [Lachnospiraceae bacterium]